MEARMTKKREWRLSAFAAFLCAAGMVVSGAQAQGNGTPTGGTNCYINGQWVFYPSGGCPGGGGGGNHPSIADIRAAKMAYKNYASYFDQAKKLYNQGISASPAQGLSLCQSALGSIDTSLQYEPGDGPALTLRRQITSCISSANGTLAVLRGDYDQGINYYREAESEYPESNAYWEKSIAWAESVRKQTEGAAHAASMYEDAFHRAQNMYNSVISLDDAHALPLCHSALSIIDEALQYEPGDGPALTLRRQITACISSCNGQLAEKRGDFDLGISYMRQAESEYPESKDLYEKNIAWAESMQQQAITVKAQIDALWAQGKQLKESKDYKGAEAAWRQIIALDPQNSAAYINLGEALNNQYRIDEAEAAYRQAIQLDPNNSTYELRLGEFLWIPVLGRSVDAEAAFRRAIQLDPTNSKAELDLGTILKWQSRYVEAEAAFRKAIQLDPNNSTYEQELGTFLMAPIIGRYTEAEAAFRKAIELDPKNWFAESQLGILFKSQNRYAEAEAALIQAFQLNPQDSSSESLLGELYKDQKRYAEAEAAYRKALEIAPADTYGHQSAQEALQAVIDLETKAQPATASSSRIGAAAALRGEVYYLTPDNQKVPIQSGSAIYLNQHVITGATGHMQVLLLDETVFTMGPNSDMVLDEFVYDPDTSVKKVSVRVMKGIFRFVTGKTAHKDPAGMKVNLPMGSIGTRGTDFEATVLEDESGDVKLYSGQLEITETKTGRIFLMNAGETVTFGSDGIFSPPNKP
jgi:Flp pilus assembly protein TadD